MARTDFTTPRLCLEVRPQRRRNGDAVARRSQLPPQRAAAGARRAGAGVQRPRRRIRGDDRRGDAQVGDADDRRAHAAAGIPARRRLSVRAAETRAARLHGAEGGRDGRAPAAAGHHPPHPGEPGQSRPPRRQRARGGGAMRRHLVGGSVDRSAPGRASLAAWPAERLLVFCDEDAPLADPVDGAGERRRPTPACRC